MHVRFVCVDLPKTSYLAADCLFTLPPYENGKPALELNLFLERNLRAGKQKPRVIELLNCVVTSLSPTFAGRDATWCRL